MGEGKQILIVEGDVQLAETMALLLEQVGYGTRRTQQPEEGLNLARRTSPALLIVNASFGYLLATLGHDQALRQIPILVLSDIGDTIDTSWPPLHTVLEKPFKPGRFLEEIEQLLALGSSPAAAAAATILVVDDDPDFSQIVSRILAANGYRVRTAANGAEAWRRIQEEAPDLVLLDIMMSTVLDGLSVSERVREDPALQDVPILVVSSIADTEYAAAFPTDEHVHLDAWISKPVDPEVLLQKVKQYLR